MLNIKEFTNRLQKILDHYEETASSFAETIGVQRSSISHILSGRNKPSLDFILKTLNAYPNVELDWLLNGKGEFTKVKQTDTQNLFSQVEEKKENQKSEFVIPHLDEDKKIERIVLFFKDGSFKNYENN